MTIPEPRPAAWSEAWKTSCFVWVADSIATNDLTGEKHHLTEIEKGVVSRLKAEPADQEALAGGLACHPGDCAAAFSSLVKRGLLVPALEDESRKFTVHRVDIETCSHCNARCQYCPVSLDPKPKHVMALDLFEHIARQIAPHRPDWVALNNFSEPLLDPFFLERCRCLEELGLKLALFTNASILKPAIREYLGESGVLRFVVVNFASDDPEEWGYLMGLPPALHARTVENIMGLAEAFQGPVSISVNGRNSTHERRTANIAALFARFSNVSVQQFPSNTLGGTINGELVGLPTKISAPKLAGCDRLASHVHISWSGDLFMCCLDYAQEFTFGNIAESSLEELLGGPRAQRYRRQVYGLEPASADLLCRKCCHIRVEP